MSPPRGGPGLQEMIKSGELAYDKIPLTYLV